MKYLLLCFIVVLTSCSKDPRIEKFEAVLGADNVETLNFMVTDFEDDFLKRQYPEMKTEAAYKQFLTELAAGKTEHWQKVSENARDRFAQSELRMQIYKVMDSVWLVNDSTVKIPVLGPALRKRMKFIDHKGQIDYTVSERSHLPEDLVSQEELNERYKNFVSSNAIGSYMRALQTIADSSDFVSEFYEVKNAAGILSTELIAEQMLKNEVDLNDYFIKRIIIAEIVY